MNLWQNLKAFLSPEENSKGKQTTYHEKHIIYEFSFK